MKGTVKFIFQPAEEGPPEGEEGGAPLMIKEGVMDNPKVDVIFGLHIESNIETGQIQYKPGAFMASSDWFTIKVKGKGSHGSQPWLGVDPIAISAQIIEGSSNHCWPANGTYKSPSCNHCWKNSWWYKKQYYSRRMHNGWNNPNTG